MSSSSMSVPVGCVLAYAGTLSGEQLNPLGWAICDGTSLLVTNYSELFAAIGTCSGGDGHEFNLPDYRGYFLRGHDPYGLHDPDTAIRTAISSGGASGANVGSVQGWATANAKDSPFFAEAPNVPNDYHHAYASSDCTMLVHAKQSFSSNSGGDSETRPINAYVQFIIKLTPSAAIPAGAIIPYAGNNGSGSVNLCKYFLLCDGKPVSKEKFPTLYDAIRSAHGKTGTDFNLPDYHGRFLRGVSIESGRDHDAPARTAMADGGSIGNQVGSIQSSATGLPKTPFSITLQVGNNRADSSVCLGHTNSVYTDDSTTVSLTATGGDKETRPMNANVDFYILHSVDPNKDDIFPIGGIIGLPGNVAPPFSEWLACDGLVISNADQYKDLYSAISHDNGGDERYFKIPDYQGRFVRGCDRGQKRDPDAMSRLPAERGGQYGDNVGSIQDYATGKPQNAITAYVPHLPRGNHDNAAAIGGNDVSNWGTTVKTQVSGGDKETRPINASIKFYIKYALAMPLNKAPLIQSKFEVKP